MTRKELIKHCKYYKGEDKCPFENGESDKPYLWWAESVWVRVCLENDKDLDEYEKLYKDAGLSDYHKEDKVPLSLKAFLFGRYMRNLYGTLKEMAEDFKQWYSKYY